MILEKGKQLASLILARGEWGEQVAAKALERKGLRIIGRNVRSCKSDKRCEIDIVAFDRTNDRVIFVEVKTHSRRVPGMRLLGVNRRKKLNVKRACLGWLRKMRWKGNYRFDVIEVYGSVCPKVDHIENVPMFTR